MDFEIARMMIDKFLQEYPDAEWGPAHIVLSDYNLGDDSIKWCRSLIDELFRTGQVDYGKPHGIHKYDNANDELIATDEFLVKLLEIPEAERDDWMDDDNDHA